MTADPLSIPPSTLEPADEPRPWGVAAFGDPEWRPPWPERPPRGSLDAAPGPARSEGSGPRRVLLIDANNHTVDLVAPCLGSGSDFALGWVRTLADALDFLEDFACDVVLSGRPGAPDRAEFDELRRAADGAPVILLGREGSHHGGLHALQQGAADLVPRARLNAEVLGRAIRYSLERRRGERALEDMAMLDSLTGVHNRAFFDAALVRALPRARRPGSDIGVLWIDLDRFKFVNDRFGHAAGDEVLRRVAGRLRARLRRGDVLCRLGGDEFGVLLQDIAAPTDAVRIAHELHRLIEQPLLVADQTLQQTASIGVATLEHGGWDADTLLRAADAAMYAAKAAGRGTVRYHTTEMESALRKRLRLEELMRGVIQRNELSLAYQPIVDLGSGRWVSVEALLRWYSPALGRWVPPSEFIPLAEETGTIREIGQWVLEESMRFAARLRRAHADIRVAVNLSARQLDHADFASRLRAGLRRHDLPGEAIGLELTETAMMSDPAAAIPTLETLRSLGIRLSVDDFGTGYSSLSHLRDLPVDTLKVDRSFVSSCDSGLGSGRIIRAVIALAKSLDLKVVAEGVETRTQLDFLRASDCDRAQGYLMARPAFPDDLLPILARRPFPSAA